MWDKAVIAILAWFITIYKYGAMRRDAQWRTGSVTFYFWAFSLFTAIGLTLMIWPVYLVFNRLVGLPNFGWLVTYAAFALAIYCMAAGCYIVLEQPRPRLMSWSLLLTLATMFVVYIVGIVTLPEKADHTVPDVLAEVVFMETIYIYMAILSAIPMFTFIRLVWYEQIVSARLRWFVGFFASFFSFAVLFVKILLTIVAFKDPLTPALNILNPLLTMAIIAVGVFMTLAFLPNKLYQVAALPFEFLGKLLALYELRSLKNRLDPLCPPVVTGRSGLKNTLGNLDYHLYRVLIAILDAKKTLTGHAVITNDLTMKPEIPVRSVGRAPLEWDDWKLQQARFLHHALQTVNDEQSFAALVKSYQRVSRTVRWKEAGSFSIGGKAFDVAYQN